MTLFRTYKLEDLLKAIFSGGTPSTTHPEYWNGEFPWLSSGETNQPYISKTEKTITQEGINQSSTRFAPPGAVVMASAGQGKTRGQTSFLKIGVYINQSIIAMVPDETQLLAKYLYYNLQFRYDELRSSSDSSSTRGSITTELLKTLKITIPDLPTQEKIASILSAYDDAIENNNKRIKILEKMAEDLYREWFVRMRFPGHKTAEYENGLPKGWKRGRLEDAIEVDPIVKIPKGEKIKSVPMAALSTSQMCIDENEISCSTTATGSRFSNGDVLLAKITPCLENGKTGFVNFLKENEYGCGSTEFIVLRARTLSPYFVYFLARSQYFRGIAIGSMNGADGRQRASVSKIKQIKLICPTQDLVNKFSEVSKPFFDAIFKLSAMNHKLVKQRNRLLPHLLSGNLEIKI